MPPAGLPTMQRSLTSATPPSRGHRAAFLLTSLALTGLQGCAYVYDQAHEHQLDKCERYATAHSANYDEWKECRARYRAVKEQVERKRKAEELRLRPMQAGRTGG